MNTNRKSNEKLPGSPATNVEFLKLLEGLMQDNEIAPDQILAAIYTRKSRLEPGAVHYSMEIQPDRAETYAAAQKWQVVDVYADPHRTGRNSKRPELQRLIRDIKAGKINVIVVHRLDRLYRNLEALLKFIRLLQQYNVRLVSVTEQMDTESPWGRLVTYVLGALAELFVLQTSERTRESKIARMRKGLPNGNLPLGYCNGICSSCTDPNGQDYCPEYGHSNRGDGRLPMHHPIDRYAVQLIHHLYNQGMSYKDIASYLNTHRFRLPGGLAAHFRTKGITGQYSPSTFGRDSIRVIIRNPFYAGLVARYPTAPLDMDTELENTHKQKQPKIRPIIQRKRQPLELQAGKHEALITTQQWGRNQQLRIGKRSTPTSVRSPGRIYLLAGVAKCWECWQAQNRVVNLRGTGGWKGTEYYRCAAMHDRYNQFRKPVENEPHTISDLEAQVRLEDERFAECHHTLRADILVPQVEALVRRLVIPEDWYEVILAYYMSDDGVSSFEREVYNLRAELGRLRVMFRLGYLTQTDLQTQGGWIQNRLSHLKPSAYSETNEIVPFLKDFHAMWEKMEISEKRVFLGIMFNGLYFDGAGQLRWVQTQSPFERFFGLSDKNFTPVAHL